jgi:TolA-binding protein
MTPTNSGDTYYFLGRMAEEAGNIEEAKAHYSRTVNDFPQSGWRWTALNRMNALN